MPSEIPEVILFEGPVIEGTVSSISAIETVTVWSDKLLAESEVTRVVADQASRNFRKILQQDNRAVKLE